MANVIELGQITEAIINSWRRKYEEREDGCYCKVCGSRIQQTTCYVSIHLKAFEPACAGSGRVIEVNFPYCPECDGEIDHATACFHAGEEVQVMIESGAAEK